ncbi:bifunctional demethylmenaquinone methyltransferase/2-methoxy-6-polyprenyl-1,4-benzoquinol methylase UbiE [Desulfurispira natronophila]|uniref:Demethylmenaquinone methyltransferase n=1 Tax=Desulfurispira natronophila TaxID=682562 RepID=A0A7W8DFV4_9BACT|nr:bifunctional demethylmenaquinone methyltransferase/2-methoxy-6-polyprenyl-1,4-benzoquinol methylase UbiE [Desulfurispira natronophila]MBB5020715.1 demethylmenaquinone methyltransferase/2-methoxy-6-polyprenyl-1,4-benzoquinol methylase [Desulfurispira natronophila]
MNEEHSKDTSDTSNRQQLPDSEKVQQMFETIAPRYDFLNRLLSGRRDVAWRRKAVACLKWSERSSILDVATGTADVALEIARQTKENVKVVGVDFSDNMLSIGKSKVSASRYSHRINLQLADAQDLPFDEDIFDSSIIAFGIRNVPDRAKALREMVRVVRPGGRVVVLEFTTPDFAPMRALYHFYFFRLLPFIGGMVSGRRDAYEYLPESVIRFPSRDEFCQTMQAAGLEEVTCKNLTFGVACLHVGTVPLSAKQ